MKLHPVFLFLSVLSLPVQAQLTPRQIDPVITRIMDSANVPGLSIAIIRDGKLAYSKGYGLTKADSTQRVTSTTIFDAASLSKPVFAYAVLQLVEAGRIALDKPLYEYLPYPDVATDERYKRITARMVLSHRSGFPNWRRNRQSKELTIAFNPGERFGYSGEGFVYLQKVVESITGKALNDLMMERVFRPLQMTNSSYVWQPAFDANFAHPHNNFGQPEAKGKPTRANTAYSLQTTADDYAKFILAILNGKGLKATTIDQMLTPQSRLPKQFGGKDTLSTGLYWGLGFGLEQTLTGDYFWHWGDNGTFKGYVTASRKDKSAVVYFANGYNGLGLIGAMVNRFVGGEHPAVAFLGYNAYDDKHSLFARYVLDKGVSAAIKPYLDGNGKSTLNEDKLGWVGDQLMYMGRPADALDVFRYNLEAYPTSANALTNYAYANLYNGNPSEAITYFRKALEQKPDNDRISKIVAQLTATPASQGGTRLVLAGYPKAKLVTVAGSFNDWDDLHTFLTRKGDVWECYLDAKPGSYTYKFVVDGKWITDPANPTTQTDESGNVNSLLTVK
ncbi:Protein flp AltName: Full=FmtA-like protein [Fibrisoma limi BUZ 3]|uniref:WGS project CAIT00000000 data, contig 8 n=1 Tax=Fibrisoma limi BUZ 3 TaxID=1185876 RepID=I2GM98_9BACT|nr:serine hydrolase [Fibrisoma limi]CCH55025.1 Protein flp AltName: Full=FmtA-like protein [Fibrisoma limi BUZ 3]